MKAAFRAYALLCAVLALLISVSALGSVSAVHAQGEDDSLKVMTYNIKHGKGNDECVDSPATPDTPPASAECALDLERAAEVIRTQDPDVVAIQEVDRFWARSGNVDQPAELAGLLGMNPCFAPNLDHPADAHGAKPHQYGVLILTKAPIVSCENTLFPFVEDWEQRGLLEARVDIDGVGEVAILGSHFQAGRSGEEEEAIRQRTEQAQITADRAKSLDIPFVIMGDLNANPDDAELSSLLGAESGLQDAWAVGGDGTDGFTSSASPDEPAEHRIDFILVSRGVTVNSTTVIDDETTKIASDHYPVVADLSLSTDATPVATPVS